MFFPLSGRKTKNYAWTGASWGRRSCEILAEDVIEGRAHGLAVPHGKGFKPSVKVLWDANGYTHGYSLERMQNEFKHTLGGWSPMAFRGIFSVLNYELRGTGLSHDYRGLARECE